MTRITCKHSGIEFESKQKEWESKDLIGKWVSVKEKYPLYKQVVLVFLDTKQIAEAVYRGEYEKDVHIFSIELTRDDTAERVTHWMPLPDAPK